MALKFTRVFSLSFLLALSPTNSIALSGVESHRQMVSLLAEVHSQTLAMNPYQGKASLELLKKERARLSETDPAKKRIDLLFHTAVAELLLGQEHQAIDHFTQAAELLATQRSVPSQVINEIQFRLGLAWLRLGETQNCVLDHRSDSCIMPIQGNGIHTIEEGSRQAISHFQNVVENTSQEATLHWNARWLLNIAHMTLGQYPQDVPPAWVIPPDIFIPEATMPHFTNIAPSLGLDTFSLSGGAVADDFDNDGYLDLFVSTSDLSGPLRFFRNGGNGTFVERTTAANLQGLVGGLNLVQADYDNDGYLDLLVLRGAWFGENGQHPNSLLHNQGDGTFLDRTFAASLGRDHYPTQTAAWADYDNDGDLDLYIGNESTDTFVAPCQLFQNQGDGTFKDTAQEAGVTNYGFAKAAVWGDYDGDRWPDLYVSNLGQPNRLYHNQGDGTFKDMAPQLGVVGPKASFPAWFWDFDNDGGLDLFVGAYDASAADIAASYMQGPFQTEAARLYRNNGSSGFEDLAKEYNLIKPSKPMGANFGDIDADGFLDFYLGTGDTDYSEIMPNLLYLSLAGQRFADLTFASGLGHLQKGHAVVFADLDHDGDLDLFEQMGGAYLGDAYADVLYENPGFDHHWLAIEVIGTRSNRSGIGVRLQIDIAVKNQTHSIYRWVGSGGSFGGNPLRQFIGLGLADKVTRLVVYWPTSDRQQIFAEIPINAIIQVTEGKESFERLTRPSFKFDLSDQSHNSHNH